MDRARLLVASCRPEEEPTLGSQVKEVNPKIMMLRLTRDDIADIVQAFGSSTFTSLELRVGAVTLEVRKPGAEETRPADALPRTVEVVAPLLGIFEAEPVTGGPPFVRPGTRVHPETTVGILHVGKDRTPVMAGVCGTVDEVLVKGGQLVEYGQPMLRVNTAPPDLPGELTDAAGADAP